MAIKSKTYYAWSPIMIADTVRGSGFVTIPVGDKVTKAQVGELDWRSLISTGSIRPQPYPKTRTFESPNNAKLRAANEAMEAAQKPFMDDEDNDDDDDEDEGLEVTDDPNGGKGADAKAPQGTKNN